MAGYKLTFDGSLVERRDVAQVASASSLVEASITSPVNWDTMNPIQNLDFNNTSTPIPNTYTDGWFTGASTPAYSGGIVQLTLAVFATHMFYTPNIGSNITWEVRFRTSNGGDLLSVNRKNLSTPNRTRSEWGGATSIYTANSTTSFVIHSGTYVNSDPNQALQFNFDSFNSAWVEIDYIKITVSGSVTITPATNVNGVAPAGGVATVASPSTIIDGQASFAGVPKLFGAKVVHDASDVLSAKYLPPATSIQDAESKLSKSKYITATATSISVESEGLGGAEKLGAGKTSIVVENIPATVEN